MGGRGRGRSGAGEASHPEVVVIGEVDVSHRARAVDALAGEGGGHHGQAERSARDEVCAGMGPQHVW